VARRLGRRARNIAAAPIRVIRATQPTNRAIVPPLELLGWWIGPAASPPDEVTDAGRVVAVLERREV
jgi:hypothetical protein